jgi:hypothetical protein
MQRNVDVPALICLALIAAGWFAMNTLVVTFGPFTHVTQFYEMGLVVIQPVALFVGVGEGHALALSGFVLLTLATLFTALAASLISARPRAQLLGWLPLALMLLCFAMLYFGGPSPQIDAAAPQSSVHDYLVRMAGHLTQHVHNTLVTHISVGAGGELALLASLALGLRSTLKYRGASRQSSGTKAVAGDTGILLS